MPTPNAGLDPGELEHEPEGRARPTPTISTTDLRRAPELEKRERRVADPAMKTKIIAWSSRRARRRAAALRHGNR